MRQFIVAYRVVFGLLALSAIAYNMMQIDPSKLVNMYSYFTILSNLIGAVVLLWGAAAGVAAAVRPVPDLVRGAAALYLTLTGIVFALLLSDIAVGLVHPFVNTVTHQVMPVVMFADWLLDPPRHELTIRETTTWLAFPIVWLAYTLIRGPIVDWYPYPFVDPRQHGYAHVARMCVGIAIGFIAGALAIAWLGNVRRRREKSTAATQAPPAPASP